MILGNFVNTEVAGSGTPVKNEQLVQELLAALQLPKEVYIIKVKAHMKQNMEEAKGNALAVADDQTIEAKTNLKALQA